MKFIGALRAAVKLKEQFHPCCALQVQGAPKEKSAVVLQKEIATQPTAMSNSEKATVACICCGICTLVCYVIGAGIGWIFSKVTIPDSKLAYDGAIVITVPVFMVLAATFLEFWLGNFQSDSKDTCAGIGCAVFVGGCISGILDLAGVGLFVGAMVKDASELADNPAGAITCGVFASFFTVLPALSNFATIGSLLILDQAKESGKRYDNIDA